MECWKNGILGSKKDSIPQDPLFHHSNRDEVPKLCVSRLRKTDGISQRDRFANKMAVED
jgi:hypothetical protein